MQNCLTNATHQAGDGGDDDDDGKSDDDKGKSGEDDGSNNIGVDSSATLDIR